jgi:hypothetical protein
VLVDPRATAPRDSESIQKMTSGGAHRRSKVDFSSLSGTENATFWFSGAGSTPTKDCFGGRHQSPALIGSGTAPAKQISNIRIFASADERSRLAERSQHRAAAARLQLI